ncbi:MAG: nodulation protein NfeD [Planctomycetota bacterium]
MSSRRRVATFAVAVASALALTFVARAQSAPTAAPPDPPGSPVALVADVEGAIGPATASQVSAVLDEAARTGAALVILRLDTPGGLSTSMRELVRGILGSSVPVVVYVAPAGARAASAGTFLLYAAHVAAMAPGTNVGAATPIALAPPGAEGQQPGTELRKARNDAAAYIRSLAELRGRNAAWGELAVREAASLSANEALERGVIDLVAPDLPALLRALDGRRVQTGAGERTLITTGLSLERREPGWRARALQVLSDPNLALILLLLGVYGLVFEAASPGGFAPGIVGGICLLLGLYALSILPVSYAGVGLLLLGLGCMAAEAFVPSFGALGIGGLVAFCAGALLLFDTDAPGFRVAWEVVLGSALVSGALLVFGLRYLWRTQRRPVATGAEALLHERGEVLDWSRGQGHVHLGGERWSATGPSRLAPGDQVSVRALDGLRLVVAPTPAASDAEEPA